MNVGPLSPCPAVGCWLWLVQEWGAALLPGGDQVWGLRAVVVPRVAAAAAMRHFPSRRVWRWG